MIQGFTGQVDMWLARTRVRADDVERLDAMFAAGECPDAIVVFVDAWTSRGGSQFLNSAGTGHYLDYLCDEVVPFVDERYPTLPSREHRGLTGKSSGGYGAMVVPMLRPDVFGALASHAGDALFECCYQPDFPPVARDLREHFDGSYEVFHQRLARGRPFRLVAALASRSRSTATPRPTLPTRIVRARRWLPFDISTGRLVDDVWQRWLERDPVRMAPVHAGRSGACGGCTWMPAGTMSTSWIWAPRRSLPELGEAGVAHSLELFDGKHGGIGYRYPRAIRELVLALRRMTHERDGRGKPSSRSPDPRRSPSSSGRARCIRASWSSSACAGSRP